MKRVKDIMTKDVVSLSPDMLVGDAAKFLFEKEISGLPVVDKEGYLLGMFTEKDLIKHALPSYVEKVGQFVYGDSSAIVKKIASLINMKVMNVMRKDVLTIDEETSLAETARLMLTGKARRMPVIRDKKIVGIIARCDVIKELVLEAGLIK